MDFESAVKYLDSFVSYEKMVRIKYDKRHFELKRVRRFLKLYGVDYEKLKYVHVAGSKGKGTVCNLIAQYLFARGYKVGLYTSPHVIDIRERFWFNGEMISKDDFAYRIADLRRFIESTGDLPTLTYFEILTVLALKFFVDTGVDYAVLEVGLGGRLDATNIVVPKLSVLTRVELEHVGILGDTLEEILDEKLGIVKKGVPLVCGLQTPAVRRLIEEKLRDKEDLYFVEGDFECAFTDNARLTFMALKILLGNVDHELFERILSDFHLIGRFDVRQMNGRTVVFDVAHTISSVQNLVDSLKVSFPRHKFVFLVSVLKDKDVTGILKLLGEVAQKIVFTYVHAGGRGISELEFKRAPVDVLCDLSFKSDPALAFDGLLDDLVENEVLVVTGSNYLVGEILRDVISQDVDRR